MDQSPLRRAAPPYPNVNMGSLFKTSGLMECPDAIRSSCPRTTVLAFDVNTAFTYCGSRRIFATTTHRLPGLLLLRGS